MKSANSVILHPWTSKFESNLSKQEVKQMKQTFLFFNKVNSRPQCTRYKLDDNIAQ